MAIDLDAYNTVPERIAEFRQKYPDGRLRPADLARPFWVTEVGGKSFVVYVAAAYRSADDPLPGIGCAWEPFPGPSSFTRDSELQNAETSAWGRAIVAALAADTRKGIATAEDVRNRTAEEPVGSAMKPGHAVADAARRAGYAATKGMSADDRADLDKARRDILELVTGVRSVTEFDRPEQYQKAIGAFNELAEGIVSLRYDSDGRACFAETTV